MQAKMVHSGRNNNSPHVLHLHHYISVSLVSLCFVDSKPNMFWPVSSDFHFSLHKTNHFCCNTIWCWWVPVYMNDTNNMTSKVYCSHGLHRILHVSTSICNVLHGETANIRRAYDSLCSHDSSRHTTNQL